MVAISTQWPPRQTGGKGKGRGGTTGHKKLAGMHEICMAVQGGWPGITIYHLCSNSPCQSSVLWSHSQKRKAEKCRLTVLSKEKESEFSVHTASV